MSTISKIFSVFAIAILLTGVVHGKQIQAPMVQAEEVAVQPEPEVPLSPLEYADKYTEQYGVDPTIFKKVMFCESNNNPEAVGDHGLAKSVMQFHETTFNSYEKKLGIDLNYNSYQDQIQLAAYMFSIGEQHQWTCYGKVVGH